MELFWVAIGGVFVLAGVALIQDYIEENGWRWRVRFWRWLG